jgi:hypothetical protein
LEGLQWAQLEHQGSLVAIDWQLQYRCNYEMASSDEEAFLCPH